MLNLNAITVQVEVPYRGPGNTVVNKPVVFDVSRAGDHYTAKPLLDPAERLVAGLPSELPFQYKDGTATSSRGLKDGNLHVIQSIGEALKARKIFN